MTTLLHISASPRGERSESLALAATFLDTYRALHPDHEIREWNLWDGSLPEFGPAAAAAKMDVFAGQEPSGPGVEAWRAAGIRTPVLVPLSADGDQRTAMREVFAAFAD